MKLFKAFYQRVLRFHKRVANVLARILLTLVYFSVLLPYGLFMRLSRKRPLGQGDSFWIPVKTPTADIDTMRRQF